MPNIHACTVRDIQHAPNAGDLLLAYAAESAIDGMPPPAPQWPAYQALEDSGVLRCLGAYSDDALIGFIVLIFPVLPHYGTRVATSESFFVMPEHRSSGAGLRLLAAAESLAAEHGAAGIFVSAPANGRLESVLQRVAGYRTTNTVFFKRLTP